MGRWTPLILMAGGLAILLGTLLGINFPMGVQNANAPTVKGRSQVLPANINVNSTASGSSGENRNSVAQNNTQDSNTDNKQDQNTDNTPDPATDNSQSGDNQSTDTNSGGPVRALW